MFRWVRTVRQTPWPAKVKLRKKACRLERQLTGSPYACRLVPGRERPDLVRADVVEQRVGRIRRVVVVAAGERQRVRVAGRQGGVDLPPARAVHAGPGQDGLRAVG